MNVCPVGMMIWRSRYGAKWKFTKYKFYTIEKKKKINDVTKWWSGATSLV